MHRPLLLLLLAATAAVLVALTPASTVPGAAAAPAPCDPMQTPPVFRDDVATSEEVLGFSLGSREVTSAESNAYVDAVDASSNRVVSGTFGTSWQGRAMRYALVGDPHNVSPAGVAAIQEAVDKLRDPETSAREAERLARTTPVVLWLMGNVHGGEESPTDAELRVLYELAAREDCAAAQILDNALVGIIPTQNPDGREAETRQNFYGFDMNRDWFARTQVETETKLELLRRYPGMLYIDAHEMGANHYFFPPTADPTYHEITSQSMSWQDFLYGGALAAEFKRQHISFFTNKVFDFFAMVYGDTVPATGFSAAGMTFEKANFDPIAQRTYEHYVTHWVSISQGALNREDILHDWHSAWVEAFRQGLAGELEPNEVNDRGNTVQLPVPNEKVRHYFLRADDADKASEVQALVRRLQRMDVDVYRLTAPFAVPDFKPYGRAAAAAVLPTGTFWIPMAQMQKHWIQSMLNEDTYVPFPYFYDVSGWSNPLLFNVSGGRSGAVLDPSAEAVPLLAEPTPPALPAEVPTVAVYRVSGGTSQLESRGWLRYLLEQVWGLPYTTATSSQIAAGALTGVDVLLVPNGDAIGTSNALGPAGRQALVDWVNSGGRYVGLRRGGTELAARLGLTTARIAEPKSDIAGTLIRVQMNTASPLAAGVGPFNWVFYDYDLVVRASDPSHVAARFPAAASEDFFVSGFARDEEELSGTAAVIDEPVGSGRVVLFGSDPNFRAWTVGMQKVLRNAVLGPDPWAAAAAAGSSLRAAKERAAKESASTVTTLQAPVRLTVGTSSVDDTKALLDGYRTSYIIRTAAGKATFLIANPGERSGDDYPLARELPAALAAAGIDVIALRLP